MHIVAAHNSFQYVEMRTVRPGQVNAKQKSSRFGYEQVCNNNNLLNTMNSTVQCCLAVTSEQNTNTTTTIISSYLAQLFINTLPILT